MIAMFRRWHWQRQRRRLATNAEAIWHGWLAQAIPENSSPFDKVNWLVIDTETTGLESDASLLSIGWVPIRGGHVRLGDAEHHLVASSAGVGDSATVHRITDTDLAEGVSLDHVLQRLASALMDHWPVFHGAALDARLLDEAFRASGAGGFPPPWVDTLQSEQRRRAHRNKPLKPGDLQLDALRSVYRLPPHTPHHALSDALATAELFCAQSLVNGLRAQPAVAEIWAH